MSLGETARKIVIPEKPEEPASDDCCGNGCDNCVWTVYQERLEKYEEALKALNSMASKDKPVQAIGGQSVSAVGGKDS